MQKSGSFFIVKEGFSFIVATALIAMAGLYFSHAFVLHLFVLALFGFSLYIFRNPNRPIEAQDLDAIVSPCDGYISDIQTLECKGKLTGECIKLTVHLPLLASGVLRAPIKGKLAYLELKRGAQLALSHPKAKHLNEQAKVMFEKSAKHRVVIKEKLNRFNPPLSFYHSLADELDMSQVYGFMLHGELEIFLPQSCRINIKRGSELKAGETVLGYFA